MVFRTRYGRRELRKEIAFRRVLSEIAKLFAGSTQKTFNEIVDQSLKLIGDFLVVDRFYIFKYDYSNNVAVNTHEYVSTAISSEKAKDKTIDMNLIYDVTKKHQKNEIIYINPLESYDHSDDLIKILKERGVKSVLNVPLFKGDNLYGFLGIDCIKKCRGYYKYEIDVLKEFGSIISKAIKRYEDSIDLNTEDAGIKILLDSINIGIWEWNLTDNTIKANNALSKILGYDIEDFKVTNIENWKKLTNKDDYTRLKDKVKEVISGKKDMYEIEMRMKHKKGHEVWLKEVGRIFRRENGVPTIIQGSHISINDLKKRETDLKVIESAIDNSSLIIAILDYDENVKYVSPEFSRLTGYTSEEVMGESLDILRSGYHKQAFFDDIWKQVKSGIAWTGVIKNKKKDGTLYWDDVTISPIYDDEGNVINFIESKKDITKKREADIYLAKRKEELEREVDQKLAEIMDAQKSSIIALAKLTESRDYDTGRHVERVQYLSKALAKTLRNNEKYKSIITQQFVDDIYFASALHDLGKIKIPDEILLKPGKLTKEEFSEMENHVKYGAEILLEMIRNYPNSTMFVMGIRIAKYHHEKYDGTGYQEGLKGELIPLEARIMALVDVYDALRSQRSYKPAFSHEKTYEMIVELSGSHFDPDVVDAFIKIHDQFGFIYESFS